MRAPQQEIPFEKDFADVVISGHVFGDFIEDEFCEMYRVTRNGGDIILFPGNSDSDNEIHEFLIRRGFRWGEVSGTRSRLCKMVSPRSA
ncbi:MAG: methyltransferase domain-containing protein [Kosmotogaceae bacterium]